MAKNKVSEWSSTPANNTDIGGIDIAEGCSPSGINNAIRELMAQVKDLQTGSDGDNLTVGGTLTITGGLSSALPVAQGGTGSTTASAARTALGLGTVATQDATAVAFTGGSISGVRIAPRVLASTANSATPSINTDNYDIVVITGQSTAITSFSSGLSGTPTNGQKLWISITGTTAIAITWGSSFESSTATLPTTTVSTNRLDVGFVWNTASSKWRCVAFA